MEKRNTTISLSQAIKLYNSKDNSLRELALQAFSKEELERTKLPKTWEDWVNQNGMIKEVEYYIDSYSTISSYSGHRDTKDTNLLGSKDQAKAILTLIKLIRLRDCYRQGWKPDWTDSNNKYTVAYYDGKIGLSNCCSIERVLSFQSEEIRDEFFKNFKDLIEEVKPLFK